MPGEVERRFIEAGQPNAEMINLGISATGPRSYYYRLRDVAFALSPDALAVFFFSGNDFLFDGQGYGQGLLPSLVDEAPGGSILGNVMPNANWVLVNRLRLSEMLATNKPVPQEFDTLAKIARLPPAERTPAVASHIKRYYYPDLSEQQIAAIFGRDGDAFWQAYASGRADDEVACRAGSSNLMTKAEIEKSPYFEATTKEQAARLVKDGDIQATLSWLTAMDRAARERGVPLVLFIVPPGSVDPDYVAYWKPWPRFYAFNVIADYRQDRLLEALAQDIDPLRRPAQGFRGRARRLSPQRCALDGQGRRDRGEPRLPGTAQARKALAGAQQPRRPAAGQGRAEPDRGLGADREGDARPCCAARPRRMIFEALAEVMRNGIGKGAFGGDAADHEAGADDADADAVLLQHVADALAPHAHRGLAGIVGGRVGQADEARQRGDDARSGRACARSCGPSSGSTVLSTPLTLTSKRLADDREIVERGIVLVDRDAGIGDHEIDGMGLVEVRSARRRKRSRSVTSIVSATTVAPLARQAAATALEPRRHRGRSGPAPRRGRHSRAPGPRRCRSRRR